MKLPKKFNDITISQFKLLAELETLEFDLIDKRIKQVAYLSNKSESDILALSTKDFNEALANISYLDNPPTDFKVKKTILINGKLFSPCYELEQLTTAQLIDLSHILEQHNNNHIQACNELLAILCRPFNLIGNSEYKPLEQINNALMFNICKVGDVFGYVFFFLNKWSECEKRIVKYLEQKTNPMLVAHLNEIEMDVEFQVFLNSGDGSIVSNNAELVAE